jgi:hypothetical protein
MANIRLQLEIRLLVRAIKEEVAVEKTFSRHIYHRES